MDPHLEHWLNTGRAAFLYCKDGYARGYADEGGHNG